MRSNEKRKNVLKNDYRKILKAIKKIKKIYKRFEKKY